jgi:glycosyltransferase involved in cell wall biosynthesis
MSDNSNNITRNYVLMLPRWYPNIKDPADGNFIEKHIKCISHNLPVKVLFVKGLENVSSGNSYNSISNENYESHILYFKLSKGPFKSFLNPILYFLTHFRGYRMIRKNSGPPALSHVHVMARTTLLAYYLKYFKSVPFVISEHWSGYYPESGKLTWSKKLLYKLLYKGASQVTAVSKSLGNAISSQGIKQSVEIIPNVVESIFYESAMNESKPEKKRLLHISNLIKDIKQVDKIILYLNELAEQRNDFVLWIVGEGADRATLEQQSAQMNNLKDRIHFKGDVNQEELVKYLSEATATLSYSKFETQSIVLLESIAMGIPVIAPKVGGIPEHCIDKGILFEVNVKDQFIKKIKPSLNV